MPVKIEGVEPHSYAAKKKIAAGDMLLSINGHPVEDILDYQFYITEPKIILQIQKPPKRPGSKEKIKKIVIRKNETEDIGLCFATYLMDSHHSCKNKCIFCFIDQLPKGMRESLYFKDDDSRLSFFFGNYITLTNLSQHDIERIIEMKISPINISVHTTNPQLRVQMMANPRAAKCMDIIHQLAAAGIQMNCQLVLCPGINDGAELERSLKDLALFHPYVSSVACVPVGLSKYRQGLYPLTEYTPAQAKECVAVIERYGSMFAAKFGTKFCFAADEFYLKAGQPIPPYSHYEEFAQLENGIGMWALLKEEFSQALEQWETAFVSGDVNSPFYIQPIKQKISVATGTAAYPLISSLVDDLKKRWHNLDCRVYCIKNNYFGESITVAGLLTGSDIIAQLEKYELGDILLLPRDALDHEGIRFLDDFTPADVEKRLHVRIQMIENEGSSLLRALLCGNPE